MENHKDLPPGAQQWARGVDKDRDRIKHLEEMVKRLSEALRLDFRKPTRGINQGDTPSVQNSMELRLDYLKDVHCYNKQDGDVVVWSAKLNKYTVGKMYVPNSVTVTNLFPWPNPELGPWKENVFPATSEVAFSGFSGGVADGLGLPLRVDGAVEFETAGGALEANALYIPFATSGMELSKTYVFSYKQEVIITGDTSTAGDGLTKPDKWELTVGNQTQAAQEISFYDSAASWGTGRVHRAFIPREASDITTIDYGNSLTIRARYSAGRKYRMSEFMLTEATNALFDNWQDLASGAEIDLLAAGAVPGETYQLDASSYLTLPTTAEVNKRLDVMADGISIGFVKQSMLTSMTTFAIPAGTTTCVLHADADFGSIQVYQPISVPYFSGDTPADSNFTYSWAGVPNNSASIRTPR